MWEWKELTGKDLLITVRDIIRDNPRRHEQRWWVGNRFAGSDFEGHAGDLARYAQAPVPEEPLDEDNPVCGTTACVAGWAAIMSAPQDARITNGFIVLDGNGRRKLAEYARLKMGLSLRQSAWLFEPRRTTEEVLDALDILISDPAANISGDISYVVKVFDETGSEVHSSHVEIDPEAYSDEYARTNEALHSSYRSY